jgi:hypothetical protein
MVDRSRGKPIANRRSTHALFAWEIHMMQTLAPLATRPVQRAITDGLLAGALSAGVLLWRGRTDTGRAFAPINAISHWIWPRQALRRNEPSLKHTATGTVVHYGSSVLWAAAYQWLRSRRRRPTALNAAVDAAAVTALAATVDLVMTPERFTPGFERRLTKPSLTLVYAGFAAGLALGGLLALRR